MQKNLTDVTSSTWIFISSDCPTWRRRPFCVCVMRSLPFHRRIRSMMLRKRQSVRCSTRWQSMSPPVPKSITRMNRSFTGTSAANSTVEHWVSSVFLDFSYCCWAMSKGSERHPFVLFAIPFIDRWSLINSLSIVSITSSADHWRWIFAMLANV